MFLFFDLCSQVQLTPFHCCSFLFFFLTNELRRRFFDSLSLTLLCTQGEILCSSVLIVLIIAFLENIVMSAYSGNIEIHSFNTGKVSLHNEHNALPCNCITIHIPLCLKSAILKDNFFFMMNMHW